MMRPKTPLVWNFEGVLAWWLLLHRGGVWLHEVLCWLPSESLFWPSLSLIVEMKVYLKGQVGCWLQRIEGFRSLLEGRVVLILLLEGQVDFCGYIQWKLDLSFWHMMIDWELCCYPHVEWLQFLWKWKLILCGSQKQMSFPVRGSLLQKLHYPLQCHHLRELLKSLRACQVGRRRWWPEHETARIERRCFKAESQEFWYQGTIP